MWRYFCNDTFDKFFSFEQYVLADVCSYNKYISTYAQYYPIKIATLLTWLKFFCNSVYDFPRVRNPRKQETDIIFFKM